MLRYRRSDGVLPPLSDVVGDLASLTETTAIVTGPDGPVTVDRAAIVAARLVAPHRREILELQRVARRGWRAAEVAELDGWQLYADQGWTGRANSVLPLASPSRPLPVMLAEAGLFYAERGLPLQVVLPLPARGVLDAELARRCWTLQRPTMVLTLPIAGPPGPDVSIGPDSSIGSGGAAGSGCHDLTTTADGTVTLEKAPSADWLAGYHYRGGRLPDYAVRLLTRHDQVRFASVRVAGSVVGIARGTVDEGWLGVTAVEVAPEQRRSGVGRTLMAAMLAWGGSCGASRCYLQVDADNAEALAFYAGLGFTLHHRYHYRLAPAES